MLNFTLVSRVLNKSKPHWCPLKMLTEQNDDIAKDEKWYTSGKTSKSDNRKIKSQLMSRKGHNLL